VLTVPIVLLRYYRDRVSGFFLSHGRISVNAFALFLVLVIPPGQKHYLLDFVDRIELNHSMNDQGAIVFTQYVLDSITVENRFPPDKEFTLQKLIRENQ
jgi:hypothetical protein